MVSFSWWPQVAQAEQKDLTMMPSLFCCWPEASFHSWPFEGLSSEQLTTWQLASSRMTSESKGEQAKQKPASF